jgi:hypothetical protein
MLGHANLQQTNTYLTVSKAGLKDSMERYGKGTICKPVPSDQPTVCNTPSDTSPQPQ